MKLDYPPGATPLEPDELRELIPSLTSQGDLNEAEAQNILQADRWARAHTRLRRNLISDFGLRELHKQMFRDIWKWAGRYRIRDTNIGIAWPQIPEQVRALCDDARYWIDNSTYPWPEIAVRFHHRLVCIHPFVNGNGRHARLAADLLLEFHGHPRLEWGGGSLVGPSERRTEYIAAIKDADRGSIERLMRFAQSK